MDEATELLVSHMKELLKRLPSLPHRWNHAELLQQAQHVLLKPLFCDLAGS